MPPAGDFPPHDSLPVRKDSIEELCGHRARALQLYRQAYDLIEQARVTHARACIGNAFISSFPHDHLRFYTPGEGAKFGKDMQTLIDRDMWRAFIVNTPIGSLMDTDERKKFENDLKGEPPEATPDNVYATLSRLYGEAGAIFRRGLVNAFSRLNREYRSHDGFKIGDRIVLTYVVVYERDCNWLRTGSRIEDELKDIDRVMHVLDGKPAPDYSQGIVSALREAVNGWKAGGPMECETEYWRLKFFKNGNGHLFPKRKDLITKANLLIAEHYGAVVGAAPDVATKAPTWNPSNLTPDFFPTPDTLAARMVDAAGLEYGEWVLEPSAGTGAIVQAIVAAKRGVSLTCVEASAERVAALHALPGLQNGLVIQGDFLEYEPGDGFDRIIMNPPFSKGQDVQHVRHALGLLNPGGRLVAIMSSGILFRQDRHYADLRADIERRGGTVEPLPPGTFKASGTGAETALVIVDNG
jgi:phospholipid N-methyltransferase